MFRGGRICSYEHINTLFDHGLMMGLSGQGAGGGADDHGLGTKDSPTFTGLTLSGFTQGSIPFFGTDGVLSQDNTGLFYDGTNLGIGTVTPQRKLHLYDATDHATVWIQTGNASKAAEVLFDQPDNMWSMGADSNGNFKIRDNTGAKNVFRINAGVPADSLLIASAGVDVLGDLTAGTIQADNGFSGSWLNNEGDTVTVVGGVITGVTA